MVIIGTKNDLDKLTAYPTEMQKSIVDVVSILDDAYGADRDVLHGMGGFVGIVGNSADIENLLDDWKIDVRSDICEYSSRLCGYVRKLFILNSDFAIELYIREDLYE